MTSLDAAQTGLQAETARADRLQQSAHDHLLLHLARNGSCGPHGDGMLVLERGEGPYVFDTRGARYIDALSCLFCAQIGYSYGAEMSAAAAAQLQRLPFNTNWGTAHPPAIELAERLSELAPAGLDRVFFTSGGSEAVESAYKLARLYHNANGEPQRLKAISRHTSYHGLSLGALALTGIEALRAPFSPPALPVVHVSNTNRFRAPDGHDEDAFTRRLLAEVEAAVVAEGPETVAVIIAEPIQNAGGCFTPPRGYWKGLREIADRYGILLVADEVISGFGRVGEWFASARYGARPDLLTVAKGLTSAYAPMGAVLVNERVAAPLYAPGASLAHGITFGGHPLCAAIALKNLDIFVRDGVLDNVRSLEGYLRDRLGELADLPIVGDIRGDGFFWAIELVADGSNSRLTAGQRDWLIRDVIPARLRTVGLIARADDRGDAVVQIAPPLIADRELLDDIVDRLGDVLAHAGRRLGESV